MNDAINNDNIYDESYNCDSHASTIDFVLNSYNVGSRSNSSSEFGEEFFETYSPETKPLKELYESLESYFYHDDESLTLQNIHEEALIWKKKTLHLRVEGGGISNPLAQEHIPPRKVEEIHLENRSPIPRNPLYNSRKDLEAKRDRLVADFDKIYHEKNQKQNIDEEISEKLRDFHILSTSKNISLRSLRPSKEEESCQSSSVPDRQSYLRNSNGHIGGRVRSSDRRDDYSHRIRSSAKKENHVNQVKLHRSLETIQEVGNIHKTANNPKKVIASLHVNGVHSRKNDSAVGKRYKNGVTLKNPNVTATRRPLSTTSTSSLSTADNSIGGNQTNRPISQNSYSPSHSLVHLMLVNQSNTSNNNNATARKPTTMPLESHSVSSSPVNPLPAANHRNQKNSSVKELCQALDTEVKAYNLKLGQLQKLRNQHSILEGEKKRNVQVYHFTQMQIGKIAETIFSHYEKIQEIGEKLMTLLHQNMTHENSVIYKNLLRIIDSGIMSVDLSVGGLADGGYNSIPNYCENITALL